MPVKKRTRKDGLPFNPARKVNLQARLNEARAIELRLEGKSYEQIAAAMNVTMPAVYQMVMRVLKRNLEDVKESIPEARKIEIMRCDELLGFIWPACKKGDSKAIDSALRIAKRRAELEGLDAPVNMKAEFGEGGTLLIETFRKMVTEAAQ